MKVITAVIDALQFNETQLNSFYQLAKAVDGKVTIALLEHTVEEMYPLAAANPEVFAYTFEALDLPSKAELEQRVQQGLKKLNNLCLVNHIKMELHEETGLPVPSLLRETRFSDLLLISRDASFSTLLRATEPSLLPDVLAGAECPVMVLPEIFSPVTEVIFTFNGSYSSMYAIREFTQLMSCYHSLPVTVLYVKEKQQPLPFEKQVKAYLEDYYGQVSFVTVEGEPATALSGYAAQHPHAIVTLGAYGRSNTSRFFHHSDANRLLYQSGLPLFITHA